MKAVILKEKNDLRLADVVDPHIESPTDAVIKVTTCAICASDLHVKKEGGREPGTIMGHEYCGVIVDAGNQIRYFKKGTELLADRFPIAGIASIANGGSEPCVKMEAYREVPESKVRSACRRSIRGFPLRITP